MRYSIILATVDRDRELYPLLFSLQSQTCRDFELLVIDQNSDERLKDILAPFRNSFPIRRIISARGHSTAFNLGRRHVTGDIVCFPDDDCWYDPDLLDRVWNLLALHPECSGVTGREVVEPGFTSGGKWDKCRGPVDAINVWRRAITFSMFLRKAPVCDYAFDESLGVGAGTPWGAGEETDYLLRLIDDGHRIVYDPGITVWHQGRSGPYTDASFSKARCYAQGIGRVLRKHKYSTYSVARHLVRPLGGALLYAIAGNKDKCRYHWSIFAGRTAGWLAPAPEAGREGVISQSEVSLVSNGEDLV